MYIDARVLREDRKLWVAERNHEGIRTIKTTHPPHVFYYEDPYGSYRYFMDDKVRLKRAYFTKYFDKEKALREKREEGILCFETDVDPVHRYLEEKYPDDEQIPPLHVSLLDIEVSQVEGMGFEGSRPDKPLGEITAITLVNLWEKRAYTLATPPPGMTMGEARTLLDEPGDDEFGALTMDDGYYLVDDERELIETFLSLIEDSDVISGWNSEFYDLPYIVNRIRVLFGEEDYRKFAAEDGFVNKFNPSEESKPYLERLNLFPCLPHMSRKSNWGEQCQVYSLRGRIHLDYMLLFQKFTKNTIGELHSYSLDYVLNVCVNQSKVQYDGTLDELREQRFRTFIAYNRQDTMGLAALEEKYTLMDQANTMAHMAGVQLEKVLGSVTIIEQAIMRALHRQKRIAFDKPPVIEDGDKIPGAYVVSPIEGLHDWVISFDIASLYPSMIRLLNISPDTLVGQFLTPKTDAFILDYCNGNPDLNSEAWGQITGVLEYHSIIDETDDLITFQYRDGHEETRTGKEWKTWLAKRNFAISGNATVFDLNRPGIIAECVDGWFHSRIADKKKAGEFDKELTLVKAELKKLDKDDVRARVELLTKAVAKWNTRQMAGKIFMNSTYGALLNRHFRFTDRRLGKSVTLSGRLVEKHMIEEASRVTQRKISEFA